MTSPPLPNPTPTSMDPNATAIQTHLGFLQGIITRMATNSSNCKTWCVTLVSALLIFIADKNKPNFTWIALIPIVLFCFLDAFYLGQERAFRNNYKEFVQQLNNQQITTANIFQISPPSGFKPLTATLSSLFSFAIYPFYLSLLLMIGLTYHFIR
jgi:hypothetical protein